MLTCADCKKRSCLLYDHANPPKNCPMNDKELQKEALDAYFAEDDGKMLRESINTAIEGKKARETRILEAIRFAKKMGWHKIGIAHCIGFCREASMAAKLIRAAGLEVETVVCTNGGINLCEFMDLPEDQLDDVEHNYSVSCNPIGQAKFLEKAGTDYNLVFGLCVGHDALFLKNSHCLASVIMVKDRSVRRDSRIGLLEAAYDLATRNDD